MKPNTFTTLLAGLLIASHAQSACVPPTNIDIVKPDSLYVDNFDGSVTDLKTGLIWSKCSIGQNWVENAANDSSDDTCANTATTHTWMGALESAQSYNNSNYLGKSDWRLPNVKELRSLVDDSCINPAINISFFPSTVSDHYWTSSVSSLDNRATTVIFYDGKIGEPTKDNKYYVRFVRGGL